MAVKEKEPYYLSELQKGQEYLRDLAKLLYKTYILKESCPKNAVIQRESLNVIYKTLILPLFDYAMPVWDWTSQNNLNKLQKHQSRAARIVTNDFSLDKKKELILLILFIGLISGKE